MSLVYVDGTQDEEAILELSKLKEPLHFKTTFTSIIVGHDMKIIVKFLRIGIETPRIKHAW